MGLPQGKAQNGNKITESSNSFWFLHLLSFTDLPASLVAQSVKNPPANAGDSGLISGPGRSPGEANGNPLQYPSLGNPMDRRAWWATVRGVVRVRHDLATKQ